MSKRHLFTSPEGLVVKSLRGIISYDPSLSLDSTNRVVYNTKHDPSKVVLISGGGSGHEPAWAGYVGENMLSASVAGDIFASPSTKQITAAIEAVPSDAGTILVVLNYTGDCMNFGLAREKAVAAGRSCRMIIVGDDVSVGKEKGRLVGRRGLAAQIAVIKIVGAAAGAGASLDECYELGNAVTKQIVSIAATLDHAHVPGRTEHGMLESDEVELGTGPHNEPGFRKVSPQPTAEDMVKEMLKYCLNEKDPDRGYVHFQSGDETVLLVSNFGGMSVLEMGALVDECLEQLARDWQIQPVRVYCGSIATSLNAPAFSVSVINLSAASKECRYTVGSMNQFLDLRTTTQWESVTGRQGVHRRPRSNQFVDPRREPTRTVDDATDLKVDPVVLDRMLRGACSQLIEAEPDLTRWDTVMGDGDCGETLRTGATAMLKALDEKKLAGKGSVVSVLHELEDIVESKMGGTLGAILGIFFVSLTTALERSVGGQGSSASPGMLLSKAVTGALESLGRYTPAKVGDRTVMDALVPFAAGLSKAGSLEEGVQEAVKGAEKTKEMQPKLGRATYTEAGSKEGGHLPPDPGAWGVRVAVKGLLEGMQGQ